MNLIVDVGNTRVKYSVFENGEELYATTSSHTQCIEEVGKLVHSYPMLKKGIVSSVRTDTQELLAYLNKHFTTIEFTHSTPIPLKICYKTPNTLGADRLAGAAGASMLFPNKAILAIDMGTAITIDYVSAKGEFIGGNISPGMNLRFNALHQLTHKLPLENSQENTPPVGQTTTEAIRAGVQEGIKHEVSGYIQNFLTTNPLGIVIITGGDAFFFAKIIKYPIFVVYNLAMIGLHTILEYNAENN